MTRMKKVLILLNLLLDKMGRELTESEKVLYEPLADFLKTHDVIKNADVMRISGKGSTTANRYLARLVELQVVDPEGEKKGRIYRRKKG